MKIWPVWVYGLTLIAATLLFLWGPTALQGMFRTIIEIQENRS